jgi:hypothetical protein
MQMNALLKLARGYTIFMSVSGFLFGQIFNGTVSAAATIAGLSGILAVALSWRLDQNAKLKRPVIACCIAGIAGIALDAVHYYTELDIPGNYYAWFLVGPLIACLVLIGYHATRVHQIVMT